MKNRKLMYVIVGIMATIVLILGILILTSKGPSRLVPAIEAAIGKTLTAQQIDSVRHIENAWNKFGDGDKNKLAYIFATAEHESGLVSKAEYRASPGDRVYDAQQDYWHTGYYGRGFVQITHQGNYEKFAKILGVDLVGNPDLAILPKYAAQILVQGMMEGLFTGKGLHDYANGKQFDFMGAGSTIHGGMRTESRSERAGVAIAIRKRI